MNVCLLRPLPATLLASGFPVLVDSGRLLPYPPKTDESTVAPSNTFTPAEDWGEDYTAKSSALATWSTVTDEDFLDRRAYRVQPSNLNLSLDIE